MSAQPFILFVQLPSHSSPLVMEVHSEWNVARIKAELQNREGIPADDIRLIHAGHEMSCDHHTLEHCAVQAHNTLQCLFRLVAGSKAKSKGGKSYKKSKKQSENAELIFKEPDQEYAQVIALLGSSRLRVQCADGIERLCTIRGKLVRRAWVSVGSIVLVSLREFEDGKCDMIHKYSDDEGRRLRAFDELPHNMKLACDAAEGENAELDDGVVFDFDLDFDENGELDISGI